MKRYILKQFSMEASSYEGYLTAYVLEWYGTKTVVARIIKNHSTFHAEEGKTRLIFCGNGGCEFFEEEDECEKRLEEVMKDE